MKTIFYTPSVIGWFHCFLVNRTFISHNFFVPFCKIFIKKNVICKSVFSCLAQEW